MTNCHTYKILRVCEYYDGKGVTCSVTHRYMESGEERFDEVRFHVFVPNGGNLDNVVQLYLQELGWGRQVGSYFASVEA